MLEGEGELLNEEDVLMDLYDLKSKEVGELLDKVESRWKQVWSVKTEPEGYLLECKYPEDGLDDVGVTMWSNYIKKGVELITKI